MSYKRERPGKRISKEEFEKMRNKYDAKHPGKTKSVTFSKESIGDILNNPEVDNIVIYLGETDEDTTTVMVIGIDGKRTLLWDTATDRGQACPPYC